MRHPQATSGTNRRASNKLPPGPAWPTLLQQVERELDAWIERRRSRSRSKRASAREARPRPNRAPDVSWER